METTIKWLLLLTIICAMIKIICLLLSEESGEETNTIMIMCMLAIFIICIPAIAAIHEKEQKNKELTISTCAINDTLKTNKTNKTEEIINQIQSKKKYIILPNQYSSSMCDFLQQNNYKKIITTPDGVLYELQESKKAI